MSQASSDAIQGFRRKVIHRILIVVMVFIVVHTYGTLGFFLVEKVPLFDAFYMAVITLSTVGYAEVFPLSQTGRVFAISIIYVGLLSTGVSVGFLTQLLFEGTVQRVFKGKHMEKVLSKMKNHFIVCGYGATGRQVVAELRAFNESVVLVDRAGVKAPQDEQFVIQLGDARRDGVLLDAGIDRAKGLVSCLTEDADNVFVVLTARSLNPQLKIVSRFKQEDTEKKLQMAGVDAAISPYAMGGKRLAHMLTNPVLLELFDASLEKSTPGVRLVSIRVPSRSPVLGRRIKESGIRENSMGALIVAVLDQKGNSNFNPNPDFILENVKELIVMGDEEQIRSLKVYLAMG